MRKKGMAAAAVSAALLFSLNGCAPANRIASADQTAEAQSGKRLLPLKMRQFLFIPNLREAVLRFPRRQERLLTTAIPFC